YIILAAYALVYTLGLFHPKYDDIFQRFEVFTPSYLFYLYLFLSTRAFFIIEVGLLLQAIILLCLPYSIFIFQNVQSRNPTEILQILPTSDTFPTILKSIFFY